MKAGINRNIQCLRAFAAYAVVAHHVIFSLNSYVAHLGIPVKAGAGGVDIFFVISGFIMASTTSLRPISPARFALDRIVRIVPIYWLLTLFAAALLAVGVKLFGQTFDMMRLLKSLFFITPPGHDPVIFVGWTLNYEMMFYIIFSFCLFIKSTSARLYALCGVIVALWAVGLLAPPGSTFTYVANSVILEFALGVLTWILSQAWTPPPRVAFGLASLGLVGLFIPDIVPLPARILATAPAAFALVFSGVALEARGLSLRDHWLRLQGDASYSIYLTHPFVLQGVGKVLIGMRLAGSAPGLCAIVGLMFVSVAGLGTLFHLWVERPLNDRLKLGRHAGASLVAAT